MNVKAILLVVGLLVGAILGWVTAPQPDVLKVGPLSVQVHGDKNGAGGTMTATDNNGQLKVQVGNPSPLDDRNKRTGIFAVIGAIIGFGVGFAVDRRRA